MSLVDRFKGQAQAPKAPSATVALIAADLLKSISPMDEQGDFFRSRAYYLEVKAKGDSTTPYEFHRHRMRQAVSLAWELVEMVDEMRPEPAS